MGAAFHGAAVVTLDAKGRVAIPTRHRAGLLDSGKSLVLTAHPGFENTRPDGGFAPRPAFRPLTRFEAQGLEKGHVVNDVLFRHVPRDEQAADRA